MPWQPYTPPAADGWRVATPRDLRPRRQRPKFSRPRPKPPARPRVFDPFKPLTDAELRARALTLSQGQLGPLLQQAREAIEARSRSGQAAITGATQALGHLFGQAAPQTAAAYNPAIQQSQAVNSELANRLGTFGQNLGTELGGKLALQDAPANLVGQIAGGAQQTAQGVSNANFTSGAADTQRLIAESAHGQEYAAKLPGIAALTGIQHARDLEASLSRELADRVSDLSTKGQQLYASLYEKMLDQEWQKTLARTSGQFKSAESAATARYRAQQIAFKKADLAWKKQKAAADRALKVRGQNVTVRGQDVSA